MVYQDATGLYHFVINVIPFISNSVVVVVAVAVAIAVAVTVVNTYLL